MNLSIVALLFMVGIGITILVIKTVFYIIEMHKINKVLNYYKFRIDENISLGRDRSTNE